MDGNGTPRVLFVYYSFTQQTRRVVDTMADVLRARGCDVTEAGIEFTDPHLREWEIPVSLVDPGGSTSAIFGKTLAAIDALKQGLHDRGIHEYDDDIASVRVLVQKTADEALPPDRVAKVVSALTAKRPRTRYLAGKDARKIALIAKTLPDHVKDLAVAHEAGLPHPK